MAVRPRIYDVPELTAAKAPGRKVCGSPSQPSKNSPDMSRLYKAIRQPQDQVQDGIHHSRGAEPAGSTERYWQRILHEGLLFASGLMPSFTEAKANRTFPGRSSQAAARDLARQGHNKPHCSCAPGHHRQGHAPGLISALSQGTRTSIRHLGNCIPPLSQFPPVCLASNGLRCLLVCLV